MKKLKCLLLGVGRILDTASDLLVDVGHDVRIQTKFHTGLHLVKYDCIFINNLHISEATFKKYLSGNVFTPSIEINNIGNLDYRITKHLFNNNSLDVGWLNQLTKSFLTSEKIVYGANTGAYELIPMIEEVLINLLIDTVNLMAKNDTNHSDTTKAVHNKIEAINSKDDLSDYLNFNLLQSKHLILKHFQALNYGNDYFNPIWIPSVIYKKRVYKICSIKKNDILSDTINIILDGNNDTTDAFKSMNGMTISLECIYSLDKYLQKISPSLLIDGKSLYTLWSEKELNWYIKVLREEHFWFNFYKKLSTTNKMYNERFDLKINHTITKLGTLKLNSIHRETTIVLSSLCSYLNLVYSLEFNMFGLIFEKNIINSYNSCFYFPLAVESSRNIAFNALHKKVSTFYNKVTKMSPLRIEFLKYLKSVLHVLEPKILFCINTTPEHYLLQQSDLLITFKIDSLNQVQEITFYGNKIFAVKEFFEGFENYLHQVLTYPDNRLDTFPLVSLSQLKLLNKKESDLQESKIPNVVQKFLIWSKHEKTKNSIAIWSDDKKITYLETFHYAVQIASSIKKHISKTSLHNISKDSNINIGIYVDEGYYQIIGILATIYLGYAYTPLDPNFPANRLKYYIDNARIKLILTTGELFLKSNFLNTFPNEHVICIDSVSLHDEYCKPNVLSTAPAYNIFTSGSTGIPKGVIVDHASLANLVYWQSKLLNIQQDDNILLFATINFDASIWSIFCALYNGAQLNILPPSFRSSPSELHKYLKDHDITIALLPPPVLETLPKRRIATLRTIVVGGDVCNQKAINYWSHKVELINAYGPTENTIISTMKRIIPGISNLNIGVPLPGVKSYVTNQFHQVLPIGFSGELILTGKQIFKNYINNKYTLLNEFKIPYSEKREKAYPTADLCKYNSDGDLLFLDRKNNFTKISGYRVDLLEIANYLNLHPKINQSYICSTKENLIAFIKLNKTLSTDEHANMVKTFPTYLSQYLPPYAIPVGYYLVETFPLTINGKIDSKQLLNKTFTSKKVISVLESQKEIDLLNIWCQILDLSEQSVSLEDNFFRSGGNSILATRFINAITDKCGITITLVEFYNKPIFSDILKNITSATNTIVENKSVPLRKIVANIGAWHGKLSPYQKSFWFIDQLNHGNSYNVCFVIKFYKVDLLALEKALYNLLAQHPILRTVFTEEANGLFQYAKAYDGFSFNLKFMLNKAIKKYLIKFAGKTFDLSKSPPLEIELLQNENNEIFLCFNLHHIIHDGRSIKIIKDHLAKAYNAYVKNNEYHGFDKQLNFFDYIEWANKNQIFLKNETSVLYWQKRLLNFQAISLPYYNHSIKNNSSENSSHYNFSINKPVFLKIKNFCKNVGITEFAFFLAIQLIWLNRICGQDNISLLTPVSTRDRSSLENIIGLFVNPLIFCFEVNKNFSFKIFVELVNRKFAEDLMYKDVSLAEIIKNLKLNRIDGYSDIAKVMLTYNAIDDLPLSCKFPNIVTDFEYIYNEFAKFDLCFNLFEHYAGLKVQLEYNSQKFLKNNIKEWASSYVYIVDQVLIEPDINLYEIEFLSKTQITRELSKLNNNFSHHSTSNDNDIYGGFVKQQKYLPSAIALIENNIKISFNELGALIDKIAWNLLSLQKDGINEQYKIGVCLPRSINLVAVILAVSKIGYIYIPIDNSYPIERINYILQDSQSNMIICDFDHASPNSPQEYAAEAININELIDKNHSAVTHNEKKVKAIRNYDYIIYTSGSTGRPKGVAANYNGILNRFSWMWDKFPFLAHEVMCAKTSISFIDSLWELFGGLLKGIPTVLIDESLVSNFEEFTNMLSINGVTRLVGVPSYINALRGC